MFLQRVVNVFGGFECFMEHAFTFLSLNVPASVVNVFGGFERFMEYAFTFLSLNVPAESCEHF